MLRELDLSDENGGGGDGGSCSGGKDVDSRRAGGDGGVDDRAGAKGGADVDEDRLDDLLDLMDSAESK